MKYQAKKAQIRQEAIDWQIKSSQMNYFYSELLNFSDYFTRLGKKYGLLKEFRENGIV